MKIDRKAIEQEFETLRNLPGVQEGLKLKLSNGDDKKFDPTRMPSTKRIDQINRACKAVLSRKK